MNPARKDVWSPETNGEVASVRQGEMGLER